jgi:hypothetical protein
MLSDMAQQMMLKIIRSEKANQIVLVTGSKQNKWGLGKIKKKKKKKNSFTSQGLKPNTFCLVAQCLNHYATTCPVYNFKVSDNYFLYE